MPSKKPWTWIFRMQDFCSHENQPQGSHRRNTILSFPNISCYTPCTAFSFFSFVNLWVIFSPNIHLVPWQIDWEKNDVSAYCMLPKRPLVISKTWGTEPKGDLKWFFSVLLFPEVTQPWHSEQDLEIHHIQLPITSVFVRAYIHIYNIITYIEILSWEIYTYTHMYYYYSLHKVNTMQYHQHTVGFSFTLFAQSASSDYKKTSDDEPVAGSVSGAKSGLLSSPRFPLSPKALPTSNSVTHLPG